MRMPTDLAAIKALPLMPESDIMEKLPLVLDLTGTFVFALSGALAGVKRQLDLFGVLVLSFAAANSGGITRDLLIGVVPPGAVADWRYLGVSLFAGLLTFYFSSLIVRMSNSVLFSTPRVSRSSRSPAHRKRWPTD